MTFSNTVPKPNDSDWVLLAKILQALSSNGDGIVGPQGPTGPQGPAGSSAAQSPWTGNINAAGFNLTGAEIVDAENVKTPLLTVLDSSDSVTARMFLDYASGAFTIRAASDNLAKATWDGTKWTFVGTAVAAITGNAGSATVLQTARAINGVDFNGSAAITIPSLFTHATLTYNATTTIDFSTSEDFRTETLTGDVTFATSNLSAAKTVTVRIIGDSSQRNLTFPASWKFIGSARPTALAASKVAVLSITSFSTTDADVIAAYSVEP